MCIWAFTVLPINLSVACCVHLSTLVGLENIYSITRVLLETFEGP